ncbi:trafficking kinesin-binding protein 2 isoform X2 [Gouania willdenowi]|uniref:Trafficking kinesin-binding protein 2-like n=1 Tax=Gouania willdenowi TaxID=441366 RepID=A0A8C5DTG5_GOUWI|nr:trafficking kinesin-binding protein 2-like isoform X2 [Gouania willdenowi]
MFEVKPRAVEKKESSTETDEGLGSSSRHYGSGSVGSGSLGSGSVYLSDSQDWAVSPSCSPDEGPAHLDNAISPLLAEETFRYMILSADRVEQMTRTYNDIEVVTHLLAERDRDLELAARIGQSLLQRNHVLQERNEAVEEQLAQALDQVHQLQYELSQKDDLLRMVSTISEESESDSMVSTPPLHLLHQPPGGSTSSSTTTIALSQLEELHNKLQEMEEENLSLRSEASQMKRDTVSYEEKEQQLVIDCVKELRESNSQMVSLTDELSQKNEELLRHQEEIALLLSQIVELQHRVKELALEKEELRIHLQASKDAQRQLTAELNELTERNSECVEMLHESQEEIKELRSKNTPPGGLRRHLSYGLYPMDSLAAEIEGTMRRELSLEEETMSEDQRVLQKRVFQTVRSINASVARATPAVPPIPGSGQTPLVMTAQPFSSNQSDEVKLGQPGSPGGNDLTRALLRLSLRRQNFLSERLFFRAERDRKLQLAEGEPSGASSPTGSVSNLSELSFGSSIFKTFLPEKLQIVKPMEGSLTLHHWQQLAKPHLATILDPHPGVVTKGFRPLTQDTAHRLSDMEEDEGGDSFPVEKGAAERGKEEEEEEEEGGITFRVTSSSTPEDRKDRRLLPLAVMPITSSSSSTVQSQSPTETTALTTSSSAPNPGKSQSSTFATYTFTTCRILHPSVITQVTSSSLGSSVMSNTPSSLRTGPSTPLTPCRLSLGDASVPRRSEAPPHGGLAKLVLERGISAQVSTETPPSSPKPAPRLLLQPSTPPNSPAPPPVGVVSRQHSDNFLASRPAELFLQDVYGLTLGRCPHPDLPSPSHQTPRVGGAAAEAANGGLVERLRRLGFTRVLHPPRSDADSSTLVSASGGSLLDGLRRNQSLPAMIGARSSAQAQPPHPTSLALPPPAWGNLKERRRQFGAVSKPPSGSAKR